MDCSKCKGKMKKGLVIDRSHLGSNSKPVWAKGLKRSISSLGALATVGKPENVVTFRCEKCGYLESYIESN